MAGIRANVIGLRSLRGKLRRLGADGPKLVAAHLSQEAEGIMAASKELVPVDTGALRTTGHAKRPRFQGASVVVELGYGGPAAPYAIFVHEDLTAHHPVGSAKYLEIPYKQALPGIPNRLARAVRAELRRRF